MKPYKGMTYYCPSYEENETEGGRVRDLAKRKKRKKAAKKARRGNR